MGSEMCIRDSAIRVISLLLCGIKLRKMKGPLLLFSFFVAMAASGQTYLDSTVNSAMKRVLFANPNEFSIGSYGEAHYNQTITENSFSNGKVDLHRVIMYMGYKFNDRLQFFSETEFEHVKEVYVEQAFMNYSYNSLFNIKAGIILIPMGFVNEFHEPTLFNGVERPNVDKYIICLLYTSPSPRDLSTSRMPSSA